MFANGADNATREKAPGMKEGPHAAQSNGCVVCGSGQNGDSILSCDGCDGEYHMYCLVPPLTEIPTEDFCCKKCMDANQTTHHEATVDAIIAAPIPSSSAGNDSLDYPSRAASFAATNESVKSTILMTEPKYTDLSKLAKKDTKKPFVAKLCQGAKSMQLGTCSNETKATYARDMAALMRCGNNVQLNSSHLDDSCIQPKVACNSRQKKLNDAAEIGAASPPAHPTSADYNASPGRGRTKSRGHGRGRGRGKRLQESSNVQSTDAHFEVKRRKLKNSRSISGLSNQKALRASEKNYLGVQVHRVYAHAQIHVNGKVVNLGTFPTAEDAAMAYDKAALKYFGDLTSFNDAHPNEVVLNFPEKRDVLLKQLLQEKKQKPAQHAQLSGMSYASCSAENAKYNLLIVKLHAWLSKLQRSVKMVEASQRVQWGLRSVSHTKEEIEACKQEGDVTSASSLVKMEIFGSGPTIKREFTTRDQKLRQSSKDIENAILVVIEELKIYAGDASTDRSYHLPPRCPPILDLLSTSRHLTLVSAISDLAHLKAKTCGKFSNSVADGHFERKLRAVVDYRVRLQMSSRNEKQKLAHLMSDVETRPSLDVNNTSTVVCDGNFIPASTDVRPEMSQESSFLKHTKYVRRKVFVSKSDSHNIGRHKGLNEHDIQTNEEVEEKLGDSTSEVNMLAAADLKMEAAGYDEQDEVVGSSADAGMYEAHFALETVDMTGKHSTNITKSGIDADAVSQDVDTIEPVRTTLDSAIRKSASHTSSLSLATVPGDDFEWEFCLAVRIVGKDEWRVLPLSSKTGVMNEFVGDLFLTEKEVLEMEVTEEEVSKSSLANEKTAWMEHLRQLHGEEGQVRQRMQHESNRQHALEGIMKIEQNRLNEMSVVYREAMDKLDIEMSLALNDHKRASQDAQLVKLMQQSFHPILRDLLGNCEDALLSCFQQLSHRCEDFVLEFEYYRNLLLILTQSPGKKLVGRDKHASLLDAADLNLNNASAVVKRENLSRVSADTTSIASEMMEVVDDDEAILTEQSDNNDDFVDLIDSSGLRQAYITFYMGEMEALWKERSSSLEMVQAIKRSLSHDAAAEKADLVAKTASPSKMFEPKALAIKLEDVDAQTALTKSIALERTSNPSSYITEGKAIKNKNETEMWPIVNATQSFDARTKADTGLEVATLVVETLRNKSALKSSEVRVKTEPQLSSAKFGRAQELRDAVESCLAQWQCIQWPKELHTTFFTAASVTLSDQSSKFKSKQTTLQSTDEGFGSPYSVMEELKRVMIGLTQDQLISVSPPVRKPTTLVMYHPVFINHQTPKNHPECPERIDRVVSILTSLARNHEETLQLDRLSMSPNELCPPETTLLMVHSPTYLRQLREKSIEAGSQSVSSPTASPSSSRALVFESDSGICEEAPKRKDRKNNRRPLLAGAFGAASLEQNGVELDTFVSSKSWDVARAAAGTVCLAVDRVVRKEYRNVVCLVRPPGHHVGRHGRTENAPSSGFCLLNNVVIGATHARLYPWVRKIAVLDWDIHHGNGTEELLKDDPDAFFASIHLYSSGDYFPGTGKSCETSNRVNVALENTGAGSGSQAFRSALELKVLPAMRAFRPDIIFISAGFDGHRDDLLGGVAAVNNLNVPAGYVEEDFAWATLEVLKVAAEVCDGRVISVLEGGYDVCQKTNSLAKSVAAHVAAICTYEAARRQMGANFPTDVEIEEGTVVRSILTAASVDVASSKMEQSIKKECMNLLERLLSVDVTDEYVTVTDDEENKDEGGDEEIQQVHDDDIEDEQETGEEKEEKEDHDVGMEESEIGREIVW